MNLRRWQSGPFVCPLTEAANFKRELSRSTQASIAATSIPTIAYLADKTIVAIGSGAYLGRYLQVSGGNICQCCRGKKRGIFSSKLNQPIYFCYFKDYMSATPALMTSRRQQMVRLIAAEKLDGSDSCIGTAKVIATYAGISNSSYIHSVARGKQKSCGGWTSRYIDDLEASAETIPVTQFEFY